MYGGQGISGLHEGHEYGRMRTMDQQPLGTHGLHPVAHVASQRRDPQRPEQPDAQRRQLDDADPEPAMPRVSSRSQRLHA
jgi:hypothetical protein